MKVDALLSAQPKGEARIEYQFFEERYRYRIAAACYAMCSSLFSNTVVCLNHTNIKKIIQAVIGSNTDP